jgi:hypothetical protein
MGKNASLWHQAGELPDRDDEPDERWPAVGAIVELAIAFSPDGKSLVYEGPEEFWNAVRDSQGAAHFDDWMPAGLTPGVYRIQARLERDVYEPDGDVSFWFQPVKLREPGGEWVEVPEP